MKLNLLILFSICLFVMSSCKEKAEYAKSEDGSLTWISIDQASKLENKDEKLYFVDVYTSWCKWCKVMDEKTFTDPAVIQLMDEKFHSVKFDAEQTDLVNWNGTEYIYAPGGRRGIHGLAPMLLNGRLSYPSFAILDKDRNPIQIIVGYKKPAQLISALNSITG